MTTSARIRAVGASRQIRWTPTLEDI